MIQSIVTGLLIRLVTWAIEKLGSLLIELIETWRRNQKLEGEAQKDFDDLQAKKKARDEARAIGGDAYEKAKSDFLASASKFGRLRV